MKGEETNGKTIFPTSCIIILMSSWQILTPTSQWVRVWRESKETKKQDKEKRGERKKGCRWRGISEFFKDLFLFKAGGVAGRSRGGES